jgi:tetratricopeptide (TPR) repeat protein
MMAEMFRRLALVLALLFSLVLPGFPQNTNVTIQPNLRLFTTMAALNAAGFDIEFRSEYHPVREAVRKYANEIDADLLGRLKAFYTSHKGQESDDAQLAKYISLAVSITDAPEFKPITSREELLPPDARSILGFTELLREFYEKAHLSQHWIEVRPEYDRAMIRIATVLREAILRTDAYLRVPFGGNGARSMSIYLELAAPVNTVNVRSNQDSYAVIIGDSANPKVDDIRHAYLHFQLDGLVTSNLTKIANNAQLLELVKKAEGVDPAYTKEVHVMITESLIRALELRMDKVAATRAREAVDNYYRLGMLLTPYFYEALATFEKEDQNIRESFVDMAHNISFRTEQERFNEKFYSIPAPQKTAARPEVPQAPPEPPPNPMRDLLKAGETAFNAGDIGTAQASFEKVLSDFDRDNGAAMYGLALIAGKKGDRDAARQYFERSIRSDFAEPSMKVWAYIYLARIFDIECNRERALEYYQQAVKVGDDTRNAQAAAREGIEQSYGDCKFK